MRFLYFYLMTDAPDRVQAAAPKHAAYWRELALPRYLGGPFGDRSGGLITFEAGAAKEAERDREDRTADGRPLSAQKQPAKTNLRLWATGALSALAVAAGATAVRRRRSPGKGV